MKLKNSARLVVILAIFMAAVSVVLLIREAFANVPMAGMIQAAISKGLTDYQPAIRVASTKEVRLWFDFGEERPCIILFNKQTAAQLGRRSYRPEDISTHIVSSTPDAPTCWSVELPP